MDAPFPPLVPGGDGLERAAVAPDALRRRMADVYGVEPACVLPVRGVAHGLELVLRRLRLDGWGAIASPEPSEELADLARIYGVLLAERPAEGVGAIVTRAPYDVTTIAPFDAAAGDPARLPVMVVDEREAEFLVEASLAPMAAMRDDLVVLRSLSLAYGLAGAPCGALISSPAQVARYAAVLEPSALPTPIVRLAEAALSPSRALAVEARIAGVKAERARMVEALKASSEVKAVEARGVWLFVTPTDAAASHEKLVRYGVRDAPKGEGLRIAVGAPEANDRALAALGVNVDSEPRRKGEAVRDTKETKIAVVVDLDAEQPRKISTGVGFFDHMLDQIAAHGGFSLTLACEGDLEIDPHHTIEDCALALGAALKQALGDRRGIARFGFALPMDEAEAKVLIDLGGRPYAVFDGTFEAGHIGEWPTEMAPHVFRSLAETLGAAIHVEVKGQNDHHKTEACFKAFGRALRQAVRIEGGAVPSTKGVL